MIDTISKRPMVIDRDELNGRFVITVRAIEFLAQHLYAIQDRNAGTKGFPRYDQLPDQLQDQWRNKAREVLWNIIDLSAVEFKERK